MRDVTMHDGGVSSAAAQLMSHEPRMLLPVFPCFSCQPVHGAFPVAAAQAAAGRA